MQKKTLTGIMLLAVIGVWGYVGYSFFAGGDCDEAFFTNEEYIEPKAIKIKVDTKQKLSLDYTDPFLKDDVRPVAKNTNTSQIKKNVVKKVEAPIVVSSYNWPKISYKGVIRNQSSPNKILALVIVNGGERIVRVGEQIEGAVVLNISSNKIELEHGKEKIQFNK